VDRPPNLDRLWDFFKFAATVDLAGIVGVLTIYPNVGLLRSQAVAVVLFLGISLVGCIMGLHMLTYDSITRGRRERVGWFERGCYYLAWSGLLGAMVGFITTALVI
jgi:hypothetical protein